MGARGPFDSGKLSAPLIIIIVRADTAGRVLPRSATTEPDTLLRLPNIVERERLWFSLRRTFSASILNI